ncbi:molybdopterin-guanine dinucleotide biosynthesis protein MobB [Aminivibrio sp.]|jgi:molybdopterin-guanine dinucleotide biosynthesis protein B|uniref:molybdopterin-guanine dinucleotide biosynthesis protein B n=1 Tax=Aminivibrio sp. TaxID=1872489 RepID=UPI001A4D12FC|nr:molybdopterin-guanine dinucleotide biosynthesis protein MobB [Aminivibrio sp.]MBL3539083.1 molybdopterin-guanine dinucleotide biosynthesis protein MobB [Aminivibrio sp.]
MPLLIAVSGFKDGGKTTLALALLQEILSAGLSAGFVKHTGEDVLSPKGTDTGRASALGISAVYWGRDGALLETGTGEISREKILEFFPGKDVVIVEGAKNIPLPRIWVGSPEDLPPDVKGVFAFFDRTGAGGDGNRIFVPGREKELAGQIIEMYEKAEGDQPASLFVKGKRIPLKPFVSGMIAGCLAGLVLPLKGVNSLKGGAEIYLKQRK